MKIIIYSLNFSPELVGIGKYTGEMVERLAQNPHNQVYVITTPPYYPDWSVQPPYISYWYQKQCINNNLFIIRCPLWVPKKPNGLKRIFHLLTFTFSSFFSIIGLSIQKRPDVIFVVEPTLFILPTTLLASYLANAKTWLHIQDFEVEAGFNMGMLKGKFLQTMILNLETWLMQRFNRVSTISKTMMQRLKKRNIDQNKQIFFPNWVNNNIIKPIQYRSCYRDYLNITNDMIVVLYSGNLGHKQGIEIIIEAARKLKENHKIIFVICGKGSEKKYLEQMTINLNNVKFLDLQPLEKLNELLGMADIHILPQKVEVSGLVMPSKLTGMLSSGRVIIATAFPDTELAEIISQCGLVTQPGDIDALVQAILQLTEDKKLRQRLGNKARLYSETYYSHETILDNFEKQVNRLLNSCQKK